LVADTIQSAASKRSAAGASRRADSDRSATVQALIREAEAYDADAILGLSFEVDRIRSADLEGTTLERLAATGLAVRIDQEA
jgi:uncharacterized protein YbjQ (UPF0145 family)